MNPHPKNTGSILFFGQTCFQKQGRRPVDGRQRYIDVDTAWMVSIGHLNCSCVITSKDQRFGRGFYGILVILVHIKYDWNYKNRIPDIELDSLETSDKKKNNLIEDWMIVKVDIFWMRFMNLYTLCSNIVVKSVAIPSSLYFYHLYYH